MNAREWMQASKRFLCDESGPTATEYAVMLALIIVVALASIGTMGQSLNQSFQDSKIEMFP